MFRSLLICALVFLAIVPAAFAHSGEGHDSAARETESEGITNALCPVTIDEPVDPEIFTDYDGKRVYFCCMRCRKQFLENPAKYAANIAYSDPTDSETPDDEGHAHSGGEKTPETWARLIRFIGKFHPVVIHFPIALLMSALLAQILAAVWQYPRSLEAARVFILIGAPTAVLSAALGWATAVNARYVGELTDILFRHRWLGTGTAVVALLTLIASERYWRTPTPARRKVFMAALVGAALLAGLTGHFGATLIHGTEHFKW